jgi:hypothetical protein
MQRHTYTTYERDSTVVHVYLRDAYILTSSIEYTIGTNTSQREQEHEEDNYSDHIQAKDTSNEYRYVAYTIVHRDDYRIYTRDNVRRTLE